MDKSARRRRIKLDLSTIEQNVTLLKWLKRELAWKRAHLKSKQMKQEQEAQDPNLFLEP